MTSTPLTTVIIDTYNYGWFIEQAIDSVLSQEFPPEQLEVIVVDDGSTDDTAERVSKYGSRIKYLKKENGGQASAFNLGFAESRGDLIVLLDADDYFLPGKLRRVFEEFQTHPDVGMVYHRLPQMHPGGVIVPATQFETLSGFLPADAQKLAKYRVHQTSCLAFRCSLLQEIFPIPESMRIQADAYLQLIAVLLAPIRTIAEDLAVYRIHGRNLCASDFQASDAEGARRLVDGSNIVRLEVQNWIRARRLRTSRSKTLRLLDGLMFLPIEQQFRFETPGRLRYFRFLVRKNYAFGPIQRRFYTAAKYIVALAALLVGYKKYALVHAWCGKALNSFRSVAGERG
jgi:glycosyltransferase involved in cell wall biosynthesis